MKEAHSKLAVTYNPVKGDVGTHEFKLFAKDPYNDAASVVARVNVKTNTPPVGDVNTPISIFGGMASDVTLDPFTDAEHDLLTYSVILASGAELPAWLSFRGDILKLSSIAMEPNLGPLQLKLQVSDGVNDAVEEAFEL